MTQPTARQRAASESQLAPAARPRRRPKADPRWSVAEGRPSPQPGRAAFQQPTCAIYLRISLDRSGQELGVDRQREDCEAIARNKGWRVVRVYTDNDLSASKADVVRPEYDAMLAAHDRGEFQHVIIWSVDRLTRQPRQLEDWIDKAENRGLFLVSRVGDLDLSTGPGQMVARILMGVAAGEAKVLSDRRKRALRQRAEKGHAHSTHRLTGYNADDTVCEPEAALVRLIFERFTAGDSLTGIAAWATEQGYPTRWPTKSGGWARNTIRAILANPRYCGRVVYQGQTVARGNWPPLVTEDVFDNVQAVLTDPRRITSRVGYHRRHLGAGLFRCFGCGDAMASHSGDKYRCQHHGHLTRGQVAVDRYVLGCVAYYLSQPNLADLVAGPDEAAGASARAEVERLRLRLAKLERQWDEDEISEPRDYYRKKDRIVAELAAAQAARARAAGHGLGSLLDNHETAPEEFLAAGLMIQRAVIDFLATVTLLPAPVGKRFADETVRIEWRH